MKLVIEIELDNDAFSEDAAEEVGRILQRVADRVATPPERTVDDVVLIDINGNYCGWAAIKRGKVKR